MESGIELLRKIASGELPPAPIRGGRIATAEGRLTAAADGKLLAHGSTTCIVLPAPA